MILARVEGNAVSTICHPSLKGWRLLVCQPVNDLGDPQSDMLLAVDTHGAGLGQTVMLSSDGINTRKVVGDDRSPLRYTVQAVIDDPKEALA